MALYIIVQHGLWEPHGILFSGYANIYFTNSSLLGYLVIYHILALLVIAMQTISLGLSLIIFYLQYSYLS